MNKIVFLAVCCALFGIMSPTRAEQQLHLQMFPEVKLNDINDPANFDESWNGETMICFSKGEINPDINEEGQPMETYEWKSSLPVAGIQPPKGEAPLPIYPDVLHIAPFPLFMWKEMSRKQMVMPLPFLFLIKRNREKRQ